MHKIIILLWPSITLTFYVYRKLEKIENGETEKISNKKTKHKKSKKKKNNKSDKDLSSSTEKKKDKEKKHFKTPAGKKEKRHVTSSSESASDSSFEDHCRSKTKSIHRSQRNGKRKNSSETSDSDRAALRLSQKRKYNDKKEDSYNKLYKQEKRYRRQSEYS